MPIHHDTQPPAEWPTPPVIGTRIRILDSHRTETVVTGFYPDDGSVLTEYGEIVANHLDDCSGFEVIR
jgi:hypothetical protein